MDLEEKTIWKTPELIVLVRSKPEEAVLGTCKFHNTSGPTGNKNGCVSLVGKKCDLACSTSGKS